MARRLPAPRAPEGKVRLCATCEVPLEQGYCPNDGRHRRYVDVDQALDTSYHDKRLATKLKDPEFRAGFEQAKREIETVDADFKVCPAGCNVPRTSLNVKRCTRHGLVLK